MSLYKAVTTRKGHAASVRRQSRQRLRSERRYRRKRSVRFFGSRYGTAVPSRDCHVGRWPPRNDKPLAFTILTIACLLCRCAAGSGVPLPYNVPSTAVPQRKKPGMPDFPASPIGSLTYRTVPWRGRGGRPRSGSSAAPRGPRCRWSRRRSCRRSYPHRRAPWQPRSACRASAP